MLLVPSKTKAQVVSGSGIADHPHGALVLSGVPIRACPNLDALGVRFDSKLTFEAQDSKLTFEAHVRGIASRVLRLVIS